MLPIRNHSEKRPTPPVAFCYIRKLMAKRAGRSLLRARRMLGPGSIEMVTAVDFPVAVLTWRRGRWVLMIRKRADPATVSRAIERLLGIRP